MSIYEVSLRTKVGNITVHFADSKDLESKLKEVQSFIDMIEKTKLVLPETPIETKVIPGMNGVYAIGPDGLPTLLKFPRAKSDIIRVALFVSSRSLSVAEITKISGVKNPLAYMQAEDFLKLPDGTYTLEAGGKNRVTSKLVPELKGG